MSRTPLFGRLQRSLRLARRSVETGRPVEEVTREWEAMKNWEAAKLTRRQLLGGTAAAAGLALVGCRPFAAPKEGSGFTGRRPRVVVVGGGIAGLTAAYRLHTRADVRVIEAQDRVGGRMFSLRGFFLGQVAEIGGELIDTGHVNLRKLAEELSIELDDFALDGAGLDRDVLFFEGRRIEEHALVEAFVPVSHRMVWDRSTLEDNWVSHRQPNGGETLDRTPLSEWLAGVETQPWLRKLLDVAFTTEYGLETRRAVGAQPSLAPGPQSHSLPGLWRQRRALPRQGGQRLHPPRPRQAAGRPGRAERPGGGGVQAAGRHLRRRGSPRGHERDGDRRPRGDRRAVSPAPSAGQGSLDPAGRQPRHPGSPETGHPRAGLRHQLQAHGGLRRTDLAPPRASPTGRTAAP